MVPGAQVLILCIGSKDDGRSCLGGQEKGSTVMTGGEGLHQWWMGGRGHTVLVAIKDVGGTIGSCGLVSIPGSKWNNA